MKTSKNILTIQKISKRLNKLFTIGMYGIPIFVLTYWLGYNHLPSLLRVTQGFYIPYSAMLDMPQTLALNSRIIGMLGTFPSLLVMIFAFSSLRRLFKLYESGVFFKQENVRQYETLGKIAFWGVLADVVHKSVLTIALTINNPPGQKMVTISLTNDHVKLIVIAIIIMLIARVMKEGCQIYDENQLTV